MDLLEMSFKMEINVCLVLSFLLFFIARNTGATCPKGNMDEVNIPANRLTFEYKLVCTKTDMYWQDTRNKLTLDLYWTGCESNVRICFVEASKPIKVTMNSKSFMMPVGSGESTDEKFCFNPSTSNSNLRVSMETYDESGQNKVTYNAVWFKIRVRGDQECHLPAVNDVQEKFTADLSCLCNLMTWGPTGSALTGEIKYKTNRDFELCFIFASSAGLYVQDKNNNNRQFNVSEDGDWSVQESCVKSSNKKANVIIRSYIEYNAVELGMKVYPAGGNTVDPQGSSPAVNVKSTAVSLILAAFYAVLFYVIES